MTGRAYMTLSQGGRSLGTLRLILATDTVPQTCQNFLALLRSRHDGGGDGYLGGVGPRFAEMLSGMWGNSAQ